MVLKKIILISAATLGTAGAVAGVGTGIAYSIQNNSNTETAHDIFKEPVSTKPVTKPENAKPAGDGTSNIQGDEGNKEEEEVVVKEITLEEAIKKLPEEIVVRPYKSEHHSNEIDTTSTQEKSSTFAYKVKKDQLSIKDKSELLTKYEFSFDIDPNANNVTTYNSGELHLEVKIIDKDKKQELKTKKVVVKGFKEANSDLKKIFAEKKNEGSEYILELNPKDDAKTKFHSVEKLNVRESIKPPKMKDAVEEPSPKNVSNLTGWFWDSTISVFYIGDLTIEGEIKVSKITKSETDNSPIFHLVSKDKTNPLRVVKANEKGVTEEVLVEEIKTTNLLATTVTVSPKNGVDKWDETFVTKLKEDNGNNKGFKIEGNEVIVNLKDDNSPNNITVKPYKVTINDVTEEKAELPFDISISFGKGTDALVLEISKNDQLMLLKDIGFSFDVYSKKINDQTNEVFEASKLKEDAHKLNTYFNTENYSKFTTRSSVEKEKLMEARKENGNGNFHAANYSNSSLNNEMKIDLKESIDPKNLEPIADTYPGNYLVFANYSYGGVTEKMASLTSVLSLVHVAKA